MTTPIIELRDYSFQYREQSKPTLSHINLAIMPGQKVAIVGASGCGKSTLLRVLNGLVPHHHRGKATGDVLVAGMNPATSTMVDISRRVGTVLQDTSGQFIGLTVGEDIAFSLENQRIPRADMPERVRQAAEMVHIEDHLGSAPQELSGGQKQRVAMAGVLVDDVDVLLFDEPLAMLDPASGRAMIELIDELNRLHHRTVVIVEHRLEDVLHRSVDRIVLMASGRIVADMAPGEMVASGLLEANGIRPPLHVSALHYAGVSVDPAAGPQDVTTMTLTDADKQRVRQWVSAAVEPQSTPRQETPAIELRHVDVSYPTIGDVEAPVVLHDISTVIGQGQMIGIVGSNGAGKSTLARAVCGFVPVTAGEVLIGGEQANGWTLAERGRRVGFVLQEPGQMLSETMIRDEISLGLKAQGIDEATGSQRIDEVLHVCGLWPFRSWPIAALSHGQKKRVTIAAILALHPDVLILDEPTAGQDFAHYSEFMDFLADVNSSGTTVILITHDIHLAVEYTERVLVVSGGKMIADDHPANVLTDEAITAQADLVTTGLYSLATRCQISDPAQLVRRFIEVDRARRRQVNHG